MGRTVDTSGVGFLMSNSAICDRRAGEKLPPKVYSILDKFPVAKSLEAKASGKRERYPVSAAAGISSTLYWI